MKRLFSLIIFVIGFFSFAEEKVLFSSTSTANLDGYDYVKNFEIKSNTGYFTNKNLRIIEPNENGLRFAVINPPKDKSVCYTVLPAYPSFLNEEEASGMIFNAGDIKSIKVICTTNRPYDEIYLMYSTSVDGETKYVKIPHDFNSVKSMEENTFIFENPNYESDVNKREIINRPLVGSPADGIYLKGFKIKTNAPSGYNVYSPYSIFYLKEVSVIYDKAEDEEKMEINKTIEDEFGFENKKEKAKKIAKQKIEERERIRNGMKALMIKAEQEK